MTTETLGACLNKIPADEKLCVIFPKFDGLLLGWSGIMIHHDLTCELGYTDGTTKTSKLAADMLDWDLDTKAKTIAAWIHED